MAASVAATASWARGGTAGTAPGIVLAEPPPETTALRLVGDYGLCQAPGADLALEFLRLEGFSDISFVGLEGAANTDEVLAHGRADFGPELGSTHVLAIDRGLPIVVLGGQHVGCVEWFAGERVPTIRELAGKRFAINAIDGSEHTFISAIAAYVGVDPRRDIDWVVEADWEKWPDLLQADQVDVVNAFPPETYVLRERGIGHVILNTTTDDPWRHFYCCMISGRREFVERYPVATKRVLRAFAKAQQLCDIDPETAARKIVESGLTERMEFARNLVAEIPYGAWRSYDPADSLRFYALRLRETGLVASTPAEILERGADFRFLEELKRELKA
jgi:NitT/TauT family transport system substrate-binding protein